MSNQVAKNIIWVIVDSVRNYHTDVDDRGRIEIMDKIGEDAIEFKTAITSAPSTVMSTSAMFTGVPSIYHSRTYDDFDFSNGDFRSLPLILEKEGYNSFNTIFFPEGRQFLGPMMGNICEEHWPKSANPSEFWPNETINEILESLIEKKAIKEPFFLYLNYNCRHDPKTSEKVEHGINLLKKNGLLDDAIMVMNSDHGYPDPSREITLMERRKFGHDLIMTDDNILTPLIVKYPNCPKVKIDTPVSLLDIMPTMLDAIGRPDLYQTSNFPSSGKSLMPIINGNLDAKTPVIRTDNRYIFQDFWVTSLRDEDYKYITNRYNGYEEFYDLKKDPLEKTNLIGSNEYSSLITKYKDELSRRDESNLEFHKNFLKSKFEELQLSKNKKIALAGKANPRFIEMLKNIVSDYSSIDLFVSEKYAKDFKLPSINQKEEYCAVIQVQDKKDPKQDWLTYAFAKQIKTKNYFYLNYNFKVLSKPQHWFFIGMKKFIDQKIPLLKSDPKSFFVDLVLMVKWIFKKRNQKL